VPLAIVLSFRDGSMAAWAEQLPAVDFVSK
jgi:hypothetical protein